MALVSVIVGSPVGVSATAGLGAYVQNKLEQAGHTVVLLGALTISPSALVLGDTSDENVAELIELIDASDGIIVTTPIQTNSYSAALKSILDVLPHEALAGKAVAPLATGGSNFHASSLDYSLVPVLRNLGARKIVSGAYVLDRDVEFHPCEVTLAHGAEFAVDTVIGAFERALDVAKVAQNDWTSSVSASRALTLHGEGAVLVDVRSNAQEPDAGAVDGAIFVPKSDIEEVFGSGSGFEKDLPVLVFCNGALGSRPVALRLEALGYTTVRQVRGGFSALVDEQLQHPTHR